MMQRRRPESPLCGLPRLLHAQDTVQEMAKNMKSSKTGATQASAAELYDFMKRVRPRYCGVHVGDYLCMGLSACLPDVHHASRAGMACAALQGMPLACPASWACTFLFHMGGCMAAGVLSVCVLNGREL